MVVLYNQSELVTYSTPTIKVNTNHFSELEQCSYTEIQEAQIVQVQQKFVL